MTGAKKVTTRMIAAGARRRTAARLSAVIAPHSVLCLRARDPSPRLRGEGAAKRRMRGAILQSSLFQHPAPFLQKLVRTRVELRERGRNRHGVARGGLAAVGDGGCDL